MSDCRTSEKIGNAQVISIEYVIISIALSLKIQNRKSKIGIKMENLYFKIAKMNYCLIFDRTELLPKQIRLKLNKQDKDYAKQNFLFASGTPKIMQYK